MDEPEASPVLLEQDVVTSHRHEPAGRYQAELLRKADVWHETIRAKLDGRWETSAFLNFSRCGKEQLFRTCRACGKWTALSYQCSLKWCPRCNWRIAKERARKLSAWARQVAQPKHMVLTERNAGTLTRSKITDHYRRLVCFRRSLMSPSQLLGRGVRGGCISVELTNEGRGWHLHSHWLLDADWLRPELIARRWGELAAQDYAVVKVKDARQSDYARQVAKYVCKGSDLAGWQPEEIVEFLTAIRGRRFFFVFGSLFGRTAEIKKALNAEGGRVCECGCHQFLYETETAATLHEIRDRERHRR